MGAGAGSIDRKYEKGRIYADNNTALKLVSCVIAEIMDF
jgi:hypothetical protein